MLCSVLRSACSTYHISTHSKHNTSTEKQDIPPPRPPQPPTTSSIHHPHSKNCPRLYRHHSSRFLNSLTTLPTLLTLPSLSTLISSIPTSMSMSSISEALQNMSLATPISTSSSALSSPDSLDSTMSVTPPSSPSSPISSTDSINGDALSGLSPKLRVMIVDDNSVNLDFLSKVLETHFKNEVLLTHKVASGVEALEQLAQEAVDLILMDIDMPVLTGVQTTEAIRAGEEHAILESNRTVPIIAVTTSDSEEQQELYRQSGMAGCVSKPIKIPVLRAAIQDALKPIG